MPTPMPASDMSDIVSPKPSVMSRRFKYSTEEQVVGTWIDGKPIYQKTVNFGALPNATEKKVAHGISNLDEVINFVGVTTNSDGITLSLPFAHETTIAKNIRFAINTNEVIIGTGINRTGNNAYVTIQYTKTTD